MELPTKIRIMGLDYSVLYVSEASQVDVHRRDSYMGQIDTFTQTIRVYDGGGNIDPTSLQHTLWHEIVHGICQTLHIATSKGNLT
ncbi:MAG: hypothetical protein KJZ93_28545, partial [Caldilineaceae bacterium]|nr:hypothetical protein [Caldilineaceae bacterium]